MTGELVRIKAADGLELVGFYAAPPGGTAGRAVLHTHGLAGNFYENRFVSSVCEAVTEEGLAFLTYNNRGHDFLATNFRDEEGATEVVPGGSAADIFEECLLDIGACAAFLRARGHEQIFFEGHSLGSVKTVYYLSVTRDPSAVGAMLLSPPDMHGLQIARVEGEDRFADALSKAEDAVRAGRGHEELTGTGFQTPVTAAAYTSLFSDPSKTDVFPVRLGADGDYGRLASMGLPILLVYGTVEEAVTVPVDDALRLLKANATSSPRVETAAIVGSRHEYLGFEAEVARLVRGFVSA